MKVNLNIEEDEQFRAYVKELIGGQVRAILREQLSGIVAGEIAKLRLLQPNSPTLSDMVAAQVKAQIDYHVRNINPQIRDQISAAVREAMGPHIAQIKNTIKDEMIKVFRSSI